MCVDTRRNAGPARTESCINVVDTELREILEAAAAVKTRTERTREMTRTISNDTTDGRRLRAGADADFEQWQHGNGREREKKRMAGAEHPEDVERGDETLSTAERTKRKAEDDE